MDRIARALLDRLLTEGARRATGGGAGVAGGAALGLAALLMGRRRRRGLGRNALLAAGAGALGKVALDAWRSREGAGVDAGHAIGEVGEDEAEGRARTLLLAMVAAAKADGHLDEEEESAIEAEMEDLPIETRALLADMIRSPATPEAIAARSRDPQEGREIYAASALLCGRDHPDEEAFLDRLAAALGLSREDARGIEDGLLGAV